MSSLSKKQPLRVVFMLPVLIQLLGAVGLVGYLSFRNGQQAVQNLASQLRTEISARIQRELQGYFGAPHAINRLNATAFAQGELDIVGATRGENLLFQQMRIYPTIAFVYCGSAQNGEFFGVLRSPETGQLQLSYGNESNQFYRDYYSLDVRGSRMHWLYQVDRPYDSRTRPWYQAALEAERPVWTDVYLAFTTGLPNVTASVPVYEASGRRLLGVCATDVVLPEEFQTFLSNLEIGKSGEAFVLDRQGHLISSSTNEPLMITTGDDVQFLQALDSNTPLVSSSTRFLIEQFGQLNQIREPQQLEFQLEGRRQFLDVLPFRDTFGLDWLIVVVVPESDFMAEIDANTRTTIALCLIALAIALITGILTTRWITFPILQLHKAVRDISKGNWDKTVDLDREDEVGELAKSFNTMIEQLRLSFEILEHQRNSFSRFFPSEYLAFLDKNQVTDVELGDHVSKEMAIMFSDIRSFTSLSERMTPQENFDFINAFLQRITPEIRAHHGVIVKFLGDGVMAVFDQGADSAMKAGISKLKHLQAYNQERGAMGKPPINLGVAIHVGHMMVGIVGEYHRLQADTLSDNVNLTARLEGLTKFYGVSLLVSEDVVNNLQDRNVYYLRFLDRAIVVGRSEAIAVYEVLDAETDDQRELKLQTLPWFERGIEDYRQGNLVNAVQSFRQVIELNPWDKTAQLYLDRLTLLLQQGLPPHWQGIWTFTQK